MKKQKISNEEEFEHLEINKSTSKEIAKVIVNKDIDEINLSEYTDVIGGIISIQDSKKVYKEIKKIQNLIKKSS